MLVKFMVSTLLLGLLCGVPAKAFAGGDLPKIGKFAPEWFMASPYSADSSVHAYVIAHHVATTLSFDGGDQLINTRRVRRIVRLLDAQGYDEATVQFSYYDPEGSAGITIQKFEAYTYNPAEPGADPVRTEVGKAEIHITRLSASWSKLSFSFPKVAAGSVLDVSYEAVAKGNSYIMPARLQEHIPVQSANFRVRANSAFDIGATAYGHFAIQSNTERVATRDLRYGPEDVIRTFWADDIPPARAEPHLTTMKNYRAHVLYEIRSFTIVGVYQKDYSGDWSTVSTRRISYSAMEAALKGKGVDELAASARQLAGADLGKFALANAAVTVVKQAVAWTRFDADVARSTRETIKKREGDAADLNLVLLATLRALDIEVYPAFIATRDYGRLLDFLPIAESTNKLILAVQDGTGFAFLDATAPLAAVGLLPDNDYNGNALVVNDRDKSQAFVNTQAGASAQTAFTANVELGEDRYLAGEVAFKISGCAAEEYLSLSGDEVAFNFEKSGLMPGFKAENIKLERTSPTEWLMTAKVRSREPIVDLGDALALNPMIAPLHAENPFGAETRNYPIEFSCARVQSRRIVIRLPQGMQVESLPEPISATTTDRSCRYRYEAIAEPGVITVETVLYVKSTTYLPEVYPEIRQLFTIAAERDGALITLVESPAEVAPAAAGQGNK